MGASAGSDAGQGARVSVGFHYAMWLLTPIVTQAYLPSAPQLAEALREGLAEPEWSARYMHTTTLLCGVVGTASLRPLLRRLSPLAATQLFLLARAASGLLYGLTCAYLGAYLASTTTIDREGIRFACGALRSALHGLSLGALGIGPTWIGARMPAELRTRHQTGLIAALGLGAAIGRLPAFTDFSLLARVAAWAARPLASPTADDMEVWLQGAPGWGCCIVSLLMMGYAARGFDDRELLPSSGLALRPPTRTLLRLCAVESLLVVAATAGFESTSLLALHAYGLGGGGGAPVLFAAQGVVSLLGGALFLRAHASLSLAALALLWNIASLSCLGIVHWPDFSSLVPLPVYLAAGLASGLGAQFSLSAHASLLSVRLPSARQAELVPLVQTMAQAGRAVGYVIFTTLSGGAFAASRALPRAPPNWALTAQLVLLGAGNLAPCLCFTLLYGRLGDAPFRGEPAGGKDLL